MKNLVKFKCGNKIVKEGWSRAAKALCALALGVVVTLGAGVYAAKTHVPTLSPETARILEHSEVTRAGIEALGMRDSLSGKTTAPTPGLK